MSSYTGSGYLRPCLSKHSCPGSLNISSAGSRNGPRSRCDLIMTGLVHAPQFPQQMSHDRHCCSDICPCTPPSPPPPPPPLPWGGSLLSSTCIHNSKNGHSLRSVSCKGHSVLQLHLCLVDLPHGWPSFAQLEGAGKAPATSPACARPMLTRCCSHSLSQHLFALLQCTLLELGN